MNSFKSASENENEIFISPEEQGNYVINITQKIGNIIEIKCPIMILLPAMVFQNDESKNRLPNSAISTSNMKKCF